MNDEQLSFLAEPSYSQCEYPIHSAASAYRYGCRCTRCLTYMRSRGSLSPRCHHEGCTNLRLKGYRHCADHPPEKEKPRRVQREAICEIPGCNRKFAWYESSLAASVRRDDLRDLYRRVCGLHRQPYMGVIRSHHLNATQALELLLVTHCSYCDGQFATLSSGRKDIVVDHDHDCCQHTSCGLCVRGFVHPRCNTEIGFLETVEKGAVGLEKGLEYITRYRERAKATILRSA